MRLKSKNQNNRKPLSANRPRTPLTSYYRGQPLTDEPTSPFKKKTPKPKYRRYVYGVVDIALVAILITALIYSLMIQPNPKVQANDITFHSLDDYRRAASNQLSHLNNRNKITFNQNGLVAALKKQFPEIKAVSVELPLFSEQPTINLAIDQASFFLDSQGTRYIINASGRAVTKAANLPKVKNLTVISDVSGFRTSPGQQVLSSNGVDFIKTVLAQCRQAKIKVTALTLPAVPQEVDLKAAGQAYYVKFFLGGDAVVQSGQFLAARHHFNEANSQPAQYLDVRVPGKVFYK